MNIWINEATIHSVNITLTDKDNTITKSFPVEDILKNEHPISPEEALRTNDPESYKPSLDLDAQTLDFTDPQNIKAHMEIPLVVTEDIDYPEPTIEELTPKISEIDELVPPMPPTPPIPEEPEVIPQSKETPEELIEEIIPEVEEESVVEVPVIIPEVETVPIIQDTIEEFKPIETVEEPVEETPPPETIKPPVEVQEAPEVRSDSNVEDVLENVKFKNPLTNMYITWDKSSEMVIMDRHREKDMCQCWTLITVKDDAEPHIPKFRIKNSFTDEYLVFKDFEDIDNRERKTLKERDIITAPLGDGSEFLWLLVPIPPNTSTDNILIINSRSKLVCDIYMHAVVPGTKIIQYNFRGGNNQLFTLEKV